MKVFRNLLWGAIALLGISAVHSQADVVRPFDQQDGKKKAHNLEPEAVPGEFVVKLRVTGMSTLSETANVLSQYGLQVQEVVNAKENLLLVSSSMAPKMMSLGSEQHSRLINKVSQLSEVEFIEPNFIYRAYDLPTNIPNVPDFDKLWGLRNTGTPDSSGRAGIVGADIDAPAAWAIETGSRDIVIAVIDTGIDYTHPDLVDNMWIQPKSDPSDPDVFGYNAINDTLDPMDDNNHGTHCAGTIAASGDNGEGIVGVAWRARLMGVKFLSGGGSGTLANAVKAIDWSRENGAHIMSNSWGGGGFSQALYDAIERARDEGILFIAAAGNSSSNNDVRPGYPASYEIDNVVSVASSNNVDEMSRFSSFGGNSVHLMAPGENIYSTIPVDRARNGNAYATYSGTSMATPHVAGAAALLLSAEPSLDHHTVIERLMSSTDKSRAFRGRIKSMGRLNVYNLLANVVGPGPVIPPDSSWSVAIPKEISTPHPYENNMELRWEIEHPGANFIRLRFAKFDLESGWDFLSIYNSEGELLERLSGRLPDNSWTTELEGDSFTLVFTSDESITHYGFDLDAYQWTDFNGQTHSVPVSAR